MNKKSAKLFRLGDAVLYGEERNPARISNILPNGNVCLDVLPYPHPTYGPGVVWGTLRYDVPLEKIELQEPLVALSRTGES